MATYSERELCVETRRQVIEDGFFDLLDAQDRAKALACGATVQYRDLYDERGRRIVADEAKVEEASGD